jgi:hypothetical protein
MSTSVAFSYARSAGRFVGHLLGSVSFALLMDPFAIIVAVVAAWLVAIGILGVGRSDVHLLSYSVWLAAMVLVAALAAAHVMITAVAGWGRAHPQQHLTSHLTQPH